MYEFSLLPFNSESSPEKFPHESDAGFGWQGLETWIIQDDKGDIWDVDWRYAYGDEIFKQHLIDIGWDEDKFLYRSKHKDPTRHKAIIYICDTGIEIPEHYSGLAECRETKQQKAGLLKNSFWQIVPERYLLGKYWQTIHRGLLPLAKLPQKYHPLLPEPLPQTLEHYHGSFATTGNLCSTSPEIINNPENEVQTVLELPKHPQRIAVGGLRTKALFKLPGDVANPLISVVTVVYNDAKNIEQTIQSVINQTKSIIEYIVIDGGSTDGTLDIICQYEDQIDYWVSEPDKGIYDAMNKGLALASGDWINFMNSGDSLIKIPDLPNKDVVCGGAIVKYPKKTRLSKSRDMKTIRKDIPASHQSMVYRKSCYRKFKYCEKLKYASDYLLLLRIFNDGGDILRSNSNISIISSGGVADNDRIAVHLEYFKILREYNYRIHNRLLLICKEYINIILKRIISSFS